MNKAVYFSLSLVLICFSIHPSYCKVDKKLEEEITKDYQAFRTHRIPGLTNQPCKAVQFVYSLQEQFQQNPNKRIAEKIAAIISEGAGVGGIDTERQATEDEKTILLGALSLSAANKVILTDPTKDSSINSKSLSHQQYVYDVYRAINNLQLNLTDYNFLNNKNVYKNFVQRIENFFLDENDKRNIVKNKPPLSSGVQDNSTAKVTIKEQDEVKGTVKPNSTRASLPSSTPPAKKTSFSLDENYVSIYDRMEEASKNQKNINKKANSEQEYVRVQELLKVCFLTGKKYEEDYLNIHKNQQELIKILKSNGREFKLTSTPSEWENPLINQKTFIETAIRSIYKKYEDEKEQKQKVGPTPRPVGNTQGSMSTFDPNYRHSNYGKGIFG